MFDSRNDAESSGLFLNFASTNYIEYGTYDSYHQFYLDVNQFTNSWNQLGMIIDGNLLSLVINGAIVNSISIEGNISYNSLYNIGQRYHQGAGHEWDGSIDNISIWDIALNENHLLEHNFNSLSGNENNLVSMYNINTNDENILIDNTDNGNDGSIYGATWADESILSINAASSNTNKDNASERALSSPLETAFI